MTFPAHSAEQPPRWTRVWLALWPVLPLVSVGSLVCLTGFRSLSRTGQLLLATFLFTQQFAALLTPDPLLSSLTALLRGLLLLGLIGLGARQRDLGVLRSLLYGLSAVVLTALVISAGWLGTDILKFRLSHPYYTSISLGVAAAFMLWLVVLNGGDRRWRTLGGGVAIVVLLLSGSRGALIVALVGLAVGLILLARRRIALVTLGAVVVGLFAVAVVPDAPGVSRLVSVDATSRDVVWSDVFSVVREHPVGGVGPYVLGSRLAPPGMKCQLWDTLEAQGISCPQWLSSVGSPWLIAHNGALQSLSDSGWFGSFGLFLLMGAAAYRAVQTRQALAAAILVGLLAGNLTDNMTLVPSPFFAEMFWITVGFLLRDADGRDAMNGALTGAAVLAVTAYPLLASLVPAPGQDVRVAALSAPRQWRLDERYVFQARLSLPPGMYRVQVRACEDSCVTTSVQAVTVSAQAAVSDLWLGTLLRDTETQHVELRVLRGSNPPWAVTPLLTKSWTVRKAP